MLEAILNALKRLYSKVCQITKNGVPVNTQNSATVTFTGTGVVGDPLIATVAGGGGGGTLQTTTVAGRTTDQGILVSGVGSALPTTGTGLFLGFVGTQAILTAYDFSTNTQKQVAIQGTPITIVSNSFVNFGAQTNMSISGIGDFSLSQGSPTGTLKVFNAAPFTAFRDFADSAYSRVKVASATETDDAITLGQLNSKFKGGKFVANGDSVTATFIIPHGLGVVPTGVSVVRGAGATFDLFATDKDATNITVTFENPPTTGTNNIVLEWVAYS